MVCCRVGVVFHFSFLCPLFMFSFMLRFCFVLFRFVSSFRCVRCRFRCFLLGWGVQKPNGFDENWNDQNLNWRSFAFWGVLRLAELRRLPSRPVGRCSKIPMFFVSVGVGSFFCTYLQTCQIYRFAGETEIVFREHRGPRHSSDAKKPKQAAKLTIRYIQFRFFHVSVLLAGWVHVGGWGAEAISEILS